MSFLKQGGGSNLFLDIEDATKPKLFRPASKQPVPVWVHNVPAPETAVQIPGGPLKALKLRQFRVEMCTSTDRRGSGCVWCNRQDPGWNLLAPRDQTNKKGQRVDFPRRCIFLLAGWSYSDNAVKVLRGGNQVYEAMDEWDTGGRSITECDWKLWKNGTGQMTEYKSQRQDATTYNGPQLDPTQLSEVMNDALKEYAQSKPEAIDALVKCLTPQEALDAYLTKNRSPGGPSLPAGAPQLALPPGQQQQLPPPFPGYQPAPVVQSLPPPSTTVAPSSQNIYPQVTTAPGSATLPTHSLPPLVQLQTAEVLTQAQQVAQRESAKATPTPLVQAPQPAAQDLPPAGQQAKNSNPLSYVLETGKYKGKTVGEVLTVDAKYLTFFRSYIKDVTVVAAINAALDAKPTMPPPTPTMQSSPVPTTPPVTMPSGVVVQQTQPVPVVSDERVALVNVCRQLIGTIPRFKARGLAENLIPFLKQFSPKFDYTDWPVADLRKLHSALLQETGGSTPPGFVVQPSA